MLGDLIYEAKGKETGYRVLDVEGPKIEVTITQNGTLRGGVEATDTVTYWSIFLDLEGHIMLKVEESSWQKMILVKWQPGLDRV
jgi:hypothetical protein